MGRSWRSGHESGISQCAISASVGITSIRGAGSRTTEPGRVFTDREIVETVWPASTYADIKDVKQCIYTIRQRLKPVHPAPLNLIVNVQGHGYKLDPKGASIHDPNLTG